MIASFPSPSANQLVLGPFHLRFYGLMIAIGVIVAVWLARKRYAERGGDPDELSTVAMWAVPGGLIGARLYHVATDWNHLYSNGRWWPQAFKIWDGGLGIPGGILGGFLVGIAVARYYKLDLARTMDVVAPAMPLAQAIGRWGNYFNQELYGRPTSLPWGVRIDRAIILNDQVSNEKYAALLGSKPYLVFQPTFLYESLWDLALVFVLLWVDRRFRLRPGKLFVAYIGGYFLGRAWVESLRSDGAALFLGFRFNFLLAVFMVAAAAIVFFWGGFRAPEGVDPKPLFGGRPRPAGGPEGGSESAGALEPDDVAGSEAIDPEDRSVDDADVDLVGAPQPATSADEVD